MQKNWTQTKTPVFNREAALKMNEIAKTVFAPIYPVIAQNARHATGINRGLCLDLGSGPGMLAMAMASTAPDMSVVAVDSSEESNEIAWENIRDAGLEARIKTAKGDVHGLPFPDNHANLIVSRGSMFFWTDLLDAFKEIFRVLAPGGHTYIGGGFGSSALKDLIVAEMLKRDPSWDCYAKKKSDADDLKRFEEMFAAIGCSTFRIINDETGFWIVLSKTAGAE